MTLQSILNYAKENGNVLDTMMNEHGHIYSHLLSMTYQKNGIKIEEARGDTLTCQSLKQNFIKDFSFLPEKKHLQPAS